MEGIVICRCCYGRKIIFSYGETLLTRKPKLVMDKCPRCNGTGEIFWIDEIMGRNRKRRKRHRKNPWNHEGEK